MIAADQQIDAMRSQLDDEAVEVLAIGGLKEKLLAARVKSTCAQERLPGPTGVA